MPISAYVCNALTFAFEIHAGHFANGRERENSEKELVFHETLSAIPPSFRHSQCCSFSLALSSFPRHEYEIEPFISEKKASEIVPHENVFTDFFPFPRFANSHFHPIYVLPFRETNAEIMTLP